MQPGWDESFYHRLTDTWPSGCHVAEVNNAILDALAPLGIRKLDMPATPARVWQAIREAKGGSRSDGAG